MTDKQNNKKYNIISKIEDDAPFGNINWCTISFITPQKIEKTKYLDVKGFKIHNGYNTWDQANDDAKKVKERKKEHDVYLSEMGKIYAWDDATKADSIEYDDNKLNELEKTRRENADKLKLMHEQFKNEYQTLYQNTNDDRRTKTMKRMQQKLYDRGLITQKEYEMIQDDVKPVKNVQEEIEIRKKMAVEIDESYQTDYLDENDSTGLKFGCITIFSPQYIKGLNTLCFKIRGLFQTMTEVQKRIGKLKTLYPNDRIYTFEVGKWCSFTELDNLPPILLLKQLNYGMKCYLENLVHEKEEFEKRKDNLKAKTEQEQKIVKAKNRRERRKAQREAKKSGKKVDDQEATPSTEINRAESGQNKYEIPSPVEPVPSIGNPEDEEAIKSIMDYLDDPELRNKYTLNQSQTQMMSVDI